MTGLEPDRHVIVEIATLVTSDDLEIVAEGPDLVIATTEAQLSEMDEVVIKMHTDSGLLEASRPRRSPSRKPETKRSSSSNQRFPIRRRFRCAVTRSASIDVSSRGTCRTSKTRCTTARSTSRL